MKTTRLAPLGMIVSLISQLQAVGDRLQQAERADDVRALAELHRRHHLALGIGEVGDGDSSGMTIARMYDDDETASAARSRSRKLIHGSPSSLAAPTQERFRALRHGRGGAADRIGHVEVRRSASANGVGVDGPGRARTRPTSPARPASRRCEARADLDQASAQLDRCCRRAAACPARRTSARTIFQSSRASPGGKARQRRLLHAALGVDVGGVLLGVGGARQDHIGAMGAGIAVMALIDHEGIGRSRDPAISSAPSR